MNPTRQNQREELRSSTLLGSYFSVIASIFGLRGFHLKKLTETKNSKKIIQNSQNEINVKEINFQGTF